jgi:molybdate transport system substrate-binding protein
MGMAAKAGSPARNIGSIEEFVDTLRTARSIAYASEGTSGAYFAGLLARLGLSEAVTPKLVAISGGQTATAVARGEAELAVVPVTSILAAAPEVMLMGTFPADLQSYIEFAIGISADATDIAAAEGLSGFLASTAVDGVLAAKGIERMPQSC